MSNQSGERKMEVTARFLGVFHSVYGKSEFTIKFKDTVLLRDAVKRIVNELPELKEALIDRELEDPRPNTLILVNGREISVLNGLETVLKDGDEVVFLPVLHTG
jgi:molybdopterin synthase sulfur carrier subunit